MDIAARGSKQRDKAHIRKTKSVPFTYQYGSYDLEVPYTEIKLSDTPTSLDPARSTTTTPKAPSATRRKA